MKKMTKAMYGKSMMKSGGASKMKKYKLGSAVNNTPGDDDKKKKKEKKEPPEFNTPIVKDEVSTTQRTYKNPLIARIGSYFTGKEYQKSTNPVTNMNTTRTFENGKKTRVLRVKEQKMGGAFKMKKYDDGGQKGSVAFNTVDKKTAMNALGIDKGKTGKYDPSNFAPIPTTKTTIETTKKYGGTAKPKMMKGGTKPKAMYGTAMKPGMMKKGGAKKK